MRQCPRCASEIGNKDKVCPRCRLPVAKMTDAQDLFAEDLEKQAESAKLNRAQKKEKKRLAKLAKNKQIISISHLPQVAAYAEKHFKVEMITSDSTAESTVTEVKGKERIAEIARMLGGGAAALKHAEAVLKKV